MSNFETWFREYLDLSIERANRECTSVDLELEIKDVCEQVKLYQDASYRSGWREGLMFLQGTLVNGGFKHDNPSVKRMLDNIQYSLDRMTNQGT